MGKRIFKREGNVLLDTFHDPFGRECRQEIDLEALIETEATSSAEFLPASAVADLLERLRNHDIHAPGEALRNLKVPVIRRGLLDAARTAPTVSLANFANALAEMADGEATSILRQRQAELLQDRQTFVDDHFFNRRAGALASTACGLLRRGEAIPESIAALGAVMRHPCRRNRSSAIRKAAALAKDISVKSDIREAVSGELVKSDVDDLDLRRAAGEWLNGERLERALADSARSLEVADYTERRKAVSYLLRHGGPAARGILVRHLSEERWLPFACSIARQLGDEVPVDIRIELASRALKDESPACRLEGLFVLESLEAGVRRRIGEPARIDEPDPVLKSLLERAMR